MEGLTTCCIARFILPSRKERLFSHRISGGFSVSASSREDSDLDKWDQMELKFGRLLGEDPKLTLAKIMGRKSNPEISHLDIEKSFDKNKGTVHDDIVNVPQQRSKDGQPTSSSKDLCSPRKKMHVAENLNLLRSVMKKGIKSEALVNEPVTAETNCSQFPEKIARKTGGSNIILRKPSTMQVDDIEMEKSSKLKIKPNLVLKMKREPIEIFRDITLLKKPEPVTLSSNPNQEKMSSDDFVGSSSIKGWNMSDNVRRAHLSATSSDRIRMHSEDFQQNKLTLTSGKVTLDATRGSLGGPSDNYMTTFSNLNGPGDELPLGLRQVKRNNGKPSEGGKSIASSSIISAQAALQGKPQRMDPSLNLRSPLVGAADVDLNHEKHNDVMKIHHSLSMSLDEREDGDWNRAANLLRTGEREEVELIRCSSRGFVVSFGSLVGFLPYCNLGARWKFLAFESWLRKKGLDPSSYKQNLSIVGSYEVQNKSFTSDSSQNAFTYPIVEEQRAPSEKLDYLLEMYDQEKTECLSSFVGQRIKVSVVLADRNIRKLMFSGRPKEKEDLVGKKRSLMASFLSLIWHKQVKIEHIKELNDTDELSHQVSDIELGCHSLKAKLSIGDVLKCCIKKITYFGIFVEVEGVPALIHQSEVSWDATLDLSSYYKVGQIVEAKVHQLDFALERITLSLKQITPDPLVEALESVVGDRNSFDGNLATVQEDVEWADVESLMKELQQIKGIHSVSKGRFFLSPGLAPTFQVYMASMFENQYKLLARSGNKVQEVLVQASLDMEQMKVAILTCTNRVE